MNRSSQHGFTLVELMVTLAVLAVIIAIAVPNMSTFTKKQAIRSAADELLLSLVYARTEAVKRNAVVSIIPKTNNTDKWADGWCITLATSGGCAAGDDLLRDFPAREGLQIKSATYKQSGDNARLRFNGKGVRVTGSGAGAGSESLFTVFDAKPGSTVSPRCVGVHKNGRAASVACN